MTLVCGVDSFGRIFSLGLRFALINVSFSVVTIALFLVFYKPIDDAVDVKQIKD